MSRWRTPAPDDILNVVSKARSYLVQLLVLMAIAVGAELLIFGRGLPEAGGTAVLAGALYALAVLVIDRVVARKNAP